MERAQRKGAVVDSGHDEVAEAADDLAVTRAGATAPNVMAPLGRLAAELSHDLNNHLAAVLNYSFILERQLEGELGAHVRELREAAWRASARARWLKLLGTPRRGEEAEIMLDELLYDLRPVLARVAGSLPLRIDLPVSLRPVRGAQSALERLIVALVVTGARRAPGDTELVLYAREHTRDEALRLRVGCRCEPRSEDANDPSVDAARPQDSGRSWAGERAFARSVFHELVKAARARLGHDARDVWVDLELGR